MSTFPADRTPDARPKLAGEYDALADLFLGGQSSSSPAARVTHDDLSASLRLVTPDAEAPAPRPGGPRGPEGADPSSPRPVDAVLLGSLPVYASAWITQFVRAETQRLGEPVALIRTLAGEGSVDLLGASPADDQPQRLASLDDAIGAAGARCARFILRTGETSEADLAAHEGVDSVVVLTGVDEPALIAAYRTLKALAPRWAGRTTPPRVRIAAMGASDQQGRRAFEKIARAARVFLDTPLEYAGSVERIEPAPSVCLFRGPTNADADTVIDAIRRPRKPVTQPDEQPAPSTVEHAAPAQDARRVSEPAATQIESKPALHPEPVGEPTPRRLTERLPGLAPVPFAVPRCADVELAADASGGLHLLALDRDDATPTASLLAAQAWASVNREILAAACATALGAPVDPARPATLHLFTARPKRVRALLDADIRVHFLGEVEVNGKRAWCVAELN